MAEQYLTAKLHEALKATGGDKKAAQKLLVAWAMRDQVLLIGFAKPHLKDLIDEHLDRATRKRHGEALSREDVETLSHNHTKGEKRSPIKAPSLKTCARQSSALRRLIHALGGRA